VSTEATLAESWIEQIHDNSRSRNGDEGCKVADGKLLDELGKLVSARESLLTLHLLSFHIGHRIGGTTLMPYPTTSDRPSSPRDRPLSCRIPASP
jgi:hypothetical protein